MLTRASIVSAYGRAGLTTLVTPSPTPPAVAGMKALAFSALAFSTLTFKARALSLLALTLLALSAGACIPTFESAEKLACLDDTDCADRYVCVRSAAERFGECVSIGALGADSGIAPDAAAPCRDDDGDGAYAGTGCTPLDCDDTDPQVFPGAPERCNGRDDDCDGRVDEGIDLSANVDHCGACGRRCEGNNAEVECLEGGCEIIACAPGWRDANGSALDGCEQPCNASEQVCGDGHDDDCDGLSDADDEDCEGALETGELANAHFYLFAWDTGAEPSIRVGELRVDPTGFRATLGEQKRTRISGSGRGEPIPDTVWTLSDFDDDGITVSHGAGPFTLYRSTRAPRSLFAGVDPAQGTFYVLIFREPSTPAPLVAHEWLSWVTSPFNELPLVPNGGAAALGWSDPVELALLRYSPPSTSGRGGVTWPFAEYRDATQGDPDGLQSLRSMSYLVAPDGSFTLELHNETPGDVERLFDGAATPAGDLAVGVHRFAGAYCTRRSIDAGECIHDPIVSLSIARSTFVGPQALAGSWRLVGVSVAHRRGALVQNLRDLSFSVDSAGSVSGDVRGAAGIFGSNETFLAPTSRLDLRGDAVGGGTLVLEGHVSSLGYGVFWDQSGATFERPMRGGLYLLVRGH